MHLTVFNLKPLWKQKTENFTSDWQKKIGINQPLSYKYQMYYFMKLFFEREGVVPTTDFQNNEDIPDYRDLIKQEVDRGNVSFAMPDIILTKQGNQNYQKALFMDYQTENGLYHDPTPFIRVGIIIATSQTVQKWDGVFDQLEKDYDRKKYALDMEATSFAGVGDFNDIDYIIAKGVGDVATGNKTFDNHYMKYAIGVSYHFIVDFSIVYKVRNRRRGGLTPLRLNKLLKNPVCNLTRADTGKTVIAAFDYRRNFRKNT